jgi:hypothetical protein
LAPPEIGVGVGCECLQHGGAMLARSGPARYRRPARMACGSIGEKAARFLRNDDTQPQPPQTPSGRRPPRRSGTGFCHRDRARTPGGHRVTLPAPGAGK